MISLSERRDRRAGMWYLSSSILLLILASLVCHLVSRGGLKLWSCALFEMTGMYCLTCGATRAAASMWQFKILESLWYNPLPVIFVTCMCIVILFEIIGLIRKKRIQIEWVPWISAGTVVILFIFCMLRNLGIIGPI